MTDYSLLSLLACIGAVGAACLFEERQRLDAIPVAALLLFFWLVEEAAYPPLDQLNPVRLFWSMGWKVRSEEFWPIYDGLLGAAAMALTVSFWSGDRRAWWGPAIWALCLWSVLIHIAQAATGGPFDLYSNRLQPPFWARLAVFYVIGIRGVVEHVAALWTAHSSGSRLRSRPLCAASARARRDRSA